MRAPTLDLNFVPKWWQENGWKKITDWQWHRMWPGFYWVYNSCFVLRTTLLHLQQRIVCNTSMLSYRSLMAFFRFSLAIFQAWFPPQRSHLSPWVTKFNRVRFIAESSSPEHSHQLCTFSADLIVFYKMVFFKLRTLFCFDFW